MLSLVRLSIAKAVIMPGALLLNGSTNRATADTRSLIETASLRSVLLMMAWNPVPHPVGLQESLAVRLVCFSCSIDIPWQWGICISACKAWLCVEAPINEQRTSQLADSA